VFGHVIEGQDVVREVERLKVDDNSRPLTDVNISSCGELVLQVRPKGMLEFISKLRQNTTCVFSDLIVLIMKL